MNKLSSFLAITCPRDGNDERVMLGYTFLHKIFSINIITAQGPCIIHNS